jgi:hypothetical protein
MYIFFLLAFLTNVCLVHQEQHQTQSQKENSAIHRSDKRVKHEKRAGTKSMGRKRSTVQTRIESTHACC